MNPITMPILLTIAIIGIVAIIIVKIYYKDEEGQKDLSSELPPIVNTTWKDPMVESYVEEEQGEKEEYSFVSKSWKEPMNQPKELKNGIASRVFQEPMNSKHHKIMGNGSNLTEQDEYVSFESKEDYYHGNTDIDYDKEKNMDVDSEIDPSEIDPILNNVDIEERNDGSFRIAKSDITIDNHDDYIIPQDYNNEKYNPDIKLEIDDSISDSMHSNKQIPLKNNGGVHEMSKIAVIGGESKNLNVGDHIIFNYNSENYSSQVLDIKHENVKIKYRSQEKWINLLDIKKIL
ncbi:hypothetical protein [Methanobrevibacter cuticularis]|nr:hypothetical protein [Methanobrevibacter cuticularis]